MKLLWPISFLLSIVATVAGARLQATEGASNPNIETLFWASIGVGTFLLVVLLIDYYRATGSRYRGSPLTKMRVAVVTVGDIAIILLALQFWVTGLGLLLMTFAFFAHGTVQTKETVSLHAEWDEEKKISEARTAATKAAKEEKAAATEAASVEAQVAQP